ncbi:MAG: D-glycero-alpha-D-manno-heptose-1,7-bisphosphate 7-phosphatase [Dehalococcoidia bacterium]
MPTPVPSHGRPAVFLDRDGVLIEDRGLLLDAADGRLLPGAAEALSRLQRAGRVLVVVSNQAVIARGLRTEAQVRETQASIEAALVAAGGPRLDAFYLCPHHPEATDPAFRAACDCRKPRPGLLLRAAEAMGLDLAASVMIGDRVTDVLAGRAAGCRTVLLRSGAHEAPPIVTPDPVPMDVKADMECDELRAAVDWILEGADE